MKLKHTGINILILSIVFGCALIAQKDLYAENQQKETWITVFVHGIMSIKPHVSINNFIRFIQDDVENTQYSHCVQFMREDPFFYQNQAMYKIGLHKTDPNNYIKGNGSAAMAYMFEKMDEYVGVPKRNNHYYTFGWSGLLSQTARYRESKELYETLQKEVTKFKKQGINPKIRILGYSHGGNVSLNLAAVHHYEHPKDPLIIDELFLIGMPIQVETDYLLADPTFKQVYNISSYGDRVQQLDFFSTRRVFSRKWFRDRNGVKTPKKLIQVHLKVHRLRKTKYDTQHMHTLAQNYDMQSVRSGHSNILRDVSPGHAELWFFGWTALHYRRTFPLYPLPAIAIAPYVSHYYPQIKDHLNEKHFLIMDIRPQYEVILVKDRWNSTIDAYIPFLTHQQHRELGQYLLGYTPNDFTPKQYSEHINMAVEKTKHLYETSEDKVIPTKRRTQRIERRHKRLLKDAEHEFENYS